jgi:hypothetical protein
MPSEIHRSDPRDNRYESRQEAASRASAAGLAKPAIISRLAVATLFAVVAGSIAWRAQYVAHGNGSDHVILQRAAQVFLHGGDPYGINLGSQLPQLWWRFFYPLPSIVLGFPFMWLSAEQCAVAFVLCSAWLLGFTLTTEGLDRVALITSVPFLAAAQFAQTGPLILALALIPATRSLSMLKPNIGLAIFAWRPAWRDVAITLAIFVVSLVFLPDWPRRWLLTIRTQPPHHAPVFIGVGAVALLAALRWRRPEARLLLAMTLIPHGLYFYDELPLFLVTRTRREVMGLSLASWFGWLAWNITSPGPRIVDTQQWVVVSMYLPAVLIVLRRPNDGPVPPRLERAIRQLPSWARGRNSGGSYSGSAE